ncbi:hypothetical protein D8674_020955 [Pyrus ussuriensis x Pyrus communis]|uniref:Uncharacterized protein n=1 Tax=Pyrus ussuriensis x Pyrus communis TaxID=2448454 RepID=A0A5N5HKK3_9ROSA|nr:hypothetical protein D8674_020955 [Pyrus ussuriensis x Pyrus communis]
MLLAIVGVLISALEFIYKGIKGKVVLIKLGKLWWFYYPPPPCYEPFGTIIEIYGLVGGIAQCVSSIIQYVYFSQHLDSPFKVSLLPAILVLCLITSRLSEDRMRIRDGAGGRLRELKSHFLKEFTPSLSFKNCTWRTKIGEDWARAHIPCIRIDNEVIIWTGMWNHLSVKESIT